jgi:hypothetical protein
VSGDCDGRPERPPSVEAVAQLKAKRMRRDGGKLQRDVNKEWRARSYFELEIDRRLVEAEVDEASS